MTRRPVILILLFTCLAVFAAGLFQIFQLRFQAGDIYPEYSSLRADPLGAMALRESLEKMPGISVRRDYSADGKLPDGRNTSYLHLAGRTSDWSWMDEQTINEIEGFVTSGGRLAVSFFPETSKPFRWLDDNEDEADSKKDSKTGKKKSAKPAAKKKKSKKTKELLRRISFKERWGLDFAFISSGQSAHALNESTLSLPETLDWHGGIVFTNLPSSWKVIYTRATHPVVIERKFGAGTVVMATDSWFLSNEAMLKDRHPDLLSWWIGPNKNVVFDEAHLGVVENPGIAELIRKYHLYGLALGLILLAALFIWKNSTTFIPAPEEGARADFVPGKDSAAGFVNLLRRNISSGEIVGLCFAEWKKSLAHGNKHLHEKEARIQALLDQEKARSVIERNPVALYRDICAVLKER